MLKKELWSLPGYRGIFDCDCACAAAPDYSGVANASKESAQIMADLGQKQLDESKRQYDLNQAVIQPVVKAQTDMMNQSADQGKQYFDYWKTNAQPVEGALRDQAMTTGTAQDQQEYADRAIADARQGFTGAQNQLIRQGLRYGWSPSKLASLAGSTATQQGSAMAGAANQARLNRENMGYARKLDVSGLYRGMPGAASGAYSVANQSGNGAVGNQIAGGNQLLTGMNQGANITGMGQQLQLQGLGSVLNAQTSYANGMNQAMMSGSGNTMGGLGSLLGGAASFAKVAGWS